LKNHLSFSRSVVP